MKEKLAIVFPGQGSQKVGMINDYMMANPSIVNDTCAEASDILGYDIQSLMTDDAEKKLNQTIYTQAAMLTAGVIAWRMRQAALEERPVLLAGHSLGEYTALVCAEAISFADCLKLVAKRAELMQAAVESGAGAMAAILGLDLEQVQGICTEIGDVWTANINAPGQIVIAGRNAAVSKAAERAKELGAKRALMLPVSVPSHCDLMLDAAKEFMGYLVAAKWSQPKIPVVHNYDVATHQDVANISKVLALQLHSPVRWVETIEYLVEQGVTKIIECGPGNVLSGLNKRIVPELGAVV